MKITVHLFAAARDSAGQSQVELNLVPGATVSDLRRVLIDTASNLTALQNSLLVAVNNEYATDDQSLTEQDEVACFPPVSGG